MAQAGFSILGMACLLGLALLLSDNRKAINWRTVGGAFAIQAGLGAFILYSTVGQNVLESISMGVQNVINYAGEGIGFLFGPLGTPAGVGFVFAFHVLPIIIFFSALIAVLYYLGIMQFVVQIFGGALRKVLGTSRAESLSATANVFVGQTEAPLVVKPYINHMSNSELFAIMVGGLASVAGSVLAGYAGLGVELKYLIAASFMAAPGGLLMAKVIKPETGETTDSKAEELAADAAESKPANVLDAAAQGASSGMGLAANVGAMLLAFVALIAMLNGLLGGIGSIFGMDNLSMQMILGYLFAPLAFVLGIPTGEIVQAGSLIGQKVVMNEFIAYIDFVAIKDTLSVHTQAVITFALCGFANLSSMAILLGGLGSLAPKRRGDIARMGFKAVLAGSLSNLMSAAIAGLFLSL